MQKYLFTVEYKDGTTYQQNAEDKSVTEPEKRSCFFDVKKDEVKTFTLKGEGHEYKVDLRDGHFEVDGTPFFLHELIREPLGNGMEKTIVLGDFRLIFFRRHVHTYRPGEKRPEEIGHTIAYFIGWQCTVEGKNYQHTIHVF